MADFSINDINEAKRRVHQMREKAREFVDEPNSEMVEKIESPIEIPPAINNVTNGFGDLLSNLFSSKDSSIILALVLILSHEKADNMLILALLYILL